VGRLSDRRRVYGQPFPWARSVALWAALALCAAAAAWAWGPGALPGSLALLAIGLAAAAALPGPDDTPVVFVPIDPY
jgi:hypothetical protein